MQKGGLILRESLQAIKNEALEAIGICDSAEALDRDRVKFLGKKGALTGILKGMGKLSPEERPVIGELANEIRAEIEGAFAEKKAGLEEVALRMRLEQESLDVTLPGKTFDQGSLHPLTLVRDEIYRIFTGLGFEVAEGPEIESDYYNFEALNLPPYHPARDMQDTFYVLEKVLLRTHTSPVQVRTMEKKAGKLPVKIICPGRVYRRDDDATHSPMFHQVEGLVIGEGITMADLKGTLLTFAKEMFGNDVKIRLRPSYFPFTEPSAEVDISCVNCGGKGCRVCKQTGWLEVLGSGMIHPNVLRYGGYDPEKVTGFALGLGIERTAMIRYGINDLRLFFDNDLRFLRQF